MDMEIRSIPTLPIFHRLHNRQLARYFGRQLKEFRLDWGLSRRALARKTGFAEATIRSYESGRRTPCLRFLCSLRSAFGIPIDYFLPIDEMERL